MVVLFDLETLKYISGAQLAYMRSSLIKYVIDNGLSNEISSEMLRGRPRASGCDRPLTDLVNKESNLFQL